MKKTSDFKFDADLMQKLMKTINKHFPKEEERALPIFLKYIKKYNKEIDNENIRFFLFLRWFILKYKIGNYVSLIDFISMNPDMEFNPRELDGIKNIQGSYESIFKVVEVSKDGTVFSLKDTLKKKEFSVEMPKPLEENIQGKLILATVTKRMNGKYSFFGPAIGYQKDEIEKIKANFFGDKNGK